MRKMRIIYLREMESGEALDLIEGASKGWVTADTAIDLYDALEYALPYLQAVVPNPRNGVNQNNTTDINCVDRAEAALAKARGEQ